MKNYKSYNELVKLESTNNVEKDSSKLIAEVENTLNNFKALDEITGESMKVMRELEIDIITLLLKKDLSTNAPTADR